MGGSAKYRLPSWAAALLTLLLSSLASAADLDAVAARFDHPDRYRHLFDRLEARGVAPDRIGDLFTSEKAARRDPEAVRLRADIREIPKHKQAERKANRRFLHEAKLLVIGPAL